MPLFKKFNDYYKNGSRENDHIFGIYCASNYGSNSFCYGLMNQILTSPTLGNDSTQAAQHNEEMRVQQGQQRKADFQHDIENAFKSKSATTLLIEFA